MITFGGFGIQQYDFIAVNGPDWQLVSPSPAGRSTSDEETCICIWLSLSHSGNGAASLLSGMLTTLELSSDRHDGGKGLLSHFGI